MIFSWHEAMAALAGVMHPGKAIVINDHVNRVGMMRHVDGVYAEMGDISPDGFTHIVGSALACMHKPVVSWIHDDPRWGNFTHLEQALAVRWADLGWEEATVATVRDLWAHKDLGAFKGGYPEAGGVPVAAHATKLLRVWPRKA